MKYCFNFVLFVLCVLHYFRAANESPRYQEWIGDLCQAISFSTSQTRIHSHRMYSWKKFLFSFATWLLSWSIQTPHKTQIPGIDSICKCRTVTLVYSFPTRLVVLKWTGQKNFSHLIRSSAPEWECVQYLCFHESKYAWISRQTQMELVQFVAIYILSFSPVFPSLFCTNFSRHFTALAR